MARTRPHPEALIRHAAAAALLVLGAGASAQAPRAARGAVAEARIDAFAGRRGSVQAGAGVAVDAGSYLRLALVGGAGVERRPGGALTGVQRIEGVARFQLDPFRQSPTGVYVGGGVGARFAAGERVRPTLVAFVAVEGRRRGGVAPALELGVGGGARVGVVVRRARRDRR